MNRTAELPPALRPWSESLAFLSVEAALHLGPLVRRLDALVRRHDAHDAHEGEPDGYGGLTTRGHPERLLLTEWLLAEEIPEEFIRRAAERELLHMEPAFLAPAPAGKVAVFCDVGPDQLGAARLVQLAALIVLHRRALARGSELVVGLSGETEWHGGELPEQFEAWRAAHTAATRDARGARGSPQRRRRAVGDGRRVAGRAGERCPAAAGHARGGVGRARADRRGRALRGPHDAAGAAARRALGADAARAGAAPPASGGVPRARRHVRRTALPGRRPAAVHARRPLRRADRREHPDEPERRRRAPARLPVQRRGAGRDVGRRPAPARAHAARRAAALRGRRQVLRERPGPRCRRGPARTRRVRGAHAAVLRPRRAALPARRSLVAPAPGRGAASGRRGARRRPRRPHRPRR